MGWFDRLRPRRRSPPGLLPETRWLVKQSQDEILVTDPEGNEHALGLADLTDVAIETNDNGPWGADVWWLLFGEDDRLATTFPQGATGDSECVGRLVAPPGFDHAPRPALRRPGA